MANPRRNSFPLNTHQIPISDFVNGNGTDAGSRNVSSGNATFQPQTALSSLKLFLKKPHAFPFLLSIFLFLTWVSLRFQHQSTKFSRSFFPYQQYQQQQLQQRSTHEHDHNVNLVKYSSSVIAKDSRGWLLNPVSFALDAGISGGATSCASIHVGEIRPGGMRGNHRHSTCNETFVIWGAKTLFRLENPLMEKGFAEVIVRANEIAIASSPRGTGHALLNIDPIQTTFFLGCQDNIINYNSSSSDFNVWNDL